MNGHLGRHGCTIGSKLDVQQRCHAGKTPGALLTAFLRHYDETQILLESQS